MDITFLLDLSGSVDVVYDIIVQFTRLVVEGLPMGSNRARVALVSYSDTSSIQFFLNTYQSKQEVLNAIAFRISGGRTNTQDAIKKTYQDVFSSSRGDRGGVPNVMVVVTDGGSNIQQSNTIREANNARNRGIEIFAVAIGEADMSEVNSIAQDPDSEHVVQIKSTNDVASAANQLLSWLCQ